MGFINAEKPAPATQVQQQQPMFGGSAAHDDMFGGMKTHYGSNEDPFAGLGNSYDANTTATTAATTAMNMSGTSNGSSFDFMNSGNANDTQQTAQTQPSFQGFG